MYGIGRSGDDGGSPSPQKVFMNATAAAALAMLLDFAYLVPILKFAELLHAGCHV